MTTDILTPYGNVAGSENDEENAAKKGAIVIYPKPNELFIDIDSCEAFDNFMDSMELLQQLFPEVRVVKRPSMSGRHAHFHITVTLPKAVSPLERIALQGALGSDPRREMYNLLRLWGGDERSVKFFEKKGRER